MNHRRLICINFLCLSILRTTHSLLRRLTSRSFSSTGSFRRSFPILTLLLFQIHRLVLFQTRIIHLLLIQHLQIRLELLLAQLRRLLVGLRLSFRRIQAIQPRPFRLARSYLRLPRCKFCLSGSFFRVGLGQCQCIFGCCIV